MPSLASHVDDLTLLRYAVGDLPTGDQASARSHLGGCGLCSGALREIRELDRELAALALGKGWPFGGESDVFGPSDPFRQRPMPFRRAAPGRDAALTSVALSGSASSGVAKQAIVAVRWDAPRLAVVLGKMDMGEIKNRFALLYAMQETGRDIAESPVGASAFADAVLELESPASGGSSPEVAERSLPWMAIRAQAHFLSAQARLWLRDFEGAWPHLVSAYYAFGRGLGDETSLAMVELSESQRRSFLRQGPGALALALRAQRTLEDRQLDDLVARAKVAEGLAWVALGDHERAADAYREALPVFERFGLWSNYVGAVNSLATALYRVGKLDEARREFARALRRFSREQHRSWIGYLSEGLGDLLFLAGRFRDGAAYFGRAAHSYEQSGFRASALLATLREAESWARSGNVTRARSRLVLVRQGLAAAEGLDPSVVGDIAASLSKADIDAEEVSQARRQLEPLLSRLRGPTR